MSDSPAHGIDNGLSALFRYDTFDPDRRTTRDATNTYLLGMNWYFSKWAKLQASYGVVDDQGHPNLTRIFLTQLQFQY